jgi:hypothetical protein
MSPRCFVDFALLPVARTRYWDDLPVIIIIWFWSVVIIFEHRWKLPHLIPSWSLEKSIKALFNFACDSKSNVKHSSKKASHQI